MARKRNYRAEYKRRIALAKQRGYSKRVGRGHPRTKISERSRKRGLKRETGIRASKFLGLKPGSDLDGAVAKDARHVFGRKPKFKKGDQGAPDYQLRLEELAKRDGVFDWLSESRFIQQMMALGLSEREAYTKWFSP